MLLVLALAGFAIDRARRVTELQRTARLLLMGFVPAFIVFVQPDLGTAIVYVVITLAILFVVGVRWTHFALLGAVLVTAVMSVLVIAPAIGHPVLKGYQQLVDEELVEKRRGLGMYVVKGARDLLLKGERQRFVNEEWPKIIATMRRLGLNPRELLAGTESKTKKSGEKA